MRRLHFVIFVVGALACVLVATRTGHAEGASVPVGVQAQLLVKVAEYDRNLLRRSIDRVHVALVVKPFDPDSARVVNQMRNALADLPTIAGLPHDEFLLDFADAATLAAACTTQGVGILYLGPGLGEEVEGIRRALETVNVLSVAAVPEYVPKGIVLGFSLRAGRPRLLINLTQAKKQHVAIRPEAISLMTVYE